MYLLRKGAYRDISHIIFKAHKISNKLVSKVSAQKTTEKSYDSYKYLFRFRSFQVLTSPKQQGMVGVVQLSTSMFPKLTILNTFANFSTKKLMVTKNKIFFRKKKRILADVPNKKERNKKRKEAKIYQFRVHDPLPGGRVNCPHVELDDPLPGGGVNCIHVELDDPLPGGRVNCTHVELDDPLPGGRVNCTM